MMLDSTSACNFGGERSDETSTRKRTSATEVMSTTKTLASPVASSLPKNPLALGDECWTTVILPPRPSKKRRLLLDSLIRLPCRSLSPSEYISKVLERYNLRSRFEGISMESLEYFEAYEENHISGELLKAIHEEDLEKLRNAFSTDELKRRNQNGETLLHVLCGKSPSQASMEMLLYLLKTIKLPPNVRDGLGRNPLHMACRHANFQDERSARSIYLQIHLLLKEAPELLAFEDYEGKTPFEYFSGVVSEDWNNFLEEKMDLEQMASRIRAHVVPSPRTSANLRHPVNKLAKEILESAETLVFSG